MSKNLAFAAYEGRPLADDQSLVAVSLPMPTPAPTDVIVKVQAISLNPVDEKMRASLPKQKTPRIFGYDATGEIVACGAAVTEFTVGQRVMYAGTTKRPGSWQQYQAVAAELIAAVPAGLSDQTAAALPLVGLTAWELLFEKMGFHAEALANQGKRLLIINGAGGVGSMLSQLAHWAGLTVAATASPQNFDWLRQHGVHQPLDYHQDLAATLAGQPAFDGVAILYATEPYLALASQVVAPFGHVGALVTPQGPLNVTALKGKAASLDFEYMFAKTDYDFNAASQGHILSQLAALAAANLLDASVTTTLQPISVATLKQGLTQLTSGHQVGKIVLTGPFEA